MSESLRTKLGPVLVANRGEIAVRIFRTARRLGLDTIAVHSEADAKALFVSMADKAYCIGPAPAQQSYLRIDAILEAAARAGAGCVHPGYGFLSEQPAFADACATAGLIFIGPSASAIRAMGLKDAAKALVARAGVPVVPGFPGESQDVDILRTEATRLGYPVLIKPIAGGGGKGMRRVDAAADFADALASAQREAQSAFGDPRVLVEKYVMCPRHVEIQIFGDRQGNIVHLFERDCSLQRRHQKVIEEAPAPGMSAALRETMGAAAIAVARAVDYVGAGTVEFIADAREGLRADRFYFMEMNTRLQVEHPVTEAITGLDLVELQFRVAAGEPLPFTQSDLRLDGHAVEARLYAEDPERDFLPSTGKIWALSFPDSVRVDSGVLRGDTVTPYYDPLIAKLIAHASTREAALDLLSQALATTRVAGPHTNARFLRALAEAEVFRAATHDTGYIDLHKDALIPDKAIDKVAAVLGAAYLVGEERKALVRSRRSALPNDPWSEAENFMLFGEYRRGLPILVDGQRVEANLIAECGWLWVELGAARTPIGSSGDLVPLPGGVIVLRGGGQTHVALFDPLVWEPGDLDSEGILHAPMHGKVVAICAGVGDVVRKGQRLAVLEAMKMEHTLLAPHAGRISEVTAKLGAQVEEGAILLRLSKPDGLDPA